MPGISRINCWANILFPEADWEDKNSNGRIDRDELSPSKSLLPEARKTEGNIQRAYLPIIDEIDRNNDGISMDEINKLVVAREGNDVSSDGEEILHSLRQNGIYKAGKAPILFVSENNIPGQAARMPQSEGVLVNLQKGKIMTMLVSFSKNGYGSATVSGAEKYVIIAVPEKIIWEEDLEMFMAGIKHELVHARQYLCGRFDEYRSLLVFILKTGKIELKMAEQLSKDASESFLEIEAYKQNIKDLIGAKKPDGMVKICAYINIQFAMLSQINGKFKEKGAAELIEVFDEMLKSTLSAEETDDLNRQIEELMGAAPEEAQKKSKIDICMTPDECKRLYPEYVGEMKF